VSQRRAVGGSGEEWAPPGVDTSVPHSARMYNWWIGGKDNFPADRELGARFAEAIPGIRTMARENRNFMERVVCYLVRQAGISQFLDIGTGIPTSPNVHEIARQFVPQARVVYVDNDPIVLTHARALLVIGEHSRTAYIDADLREPGKILTDAAMLETLDLQQPVGLLMIAVLMLIADEDDPWDKAEVLMDALPSGSYVAITHPGQDFDPEAMATVVAAASEGGMILVPRVRAEVERFFTGWELIEPGVVPVTAWHPEDERPADPNAAYYWAGVARKP
jgi:hypothetical protein